MSFKDSQRDETGATATEYGLLVGLIAVAILVGVGLFGDALSAYYDTLTAGFNDAFN